MSKDKEKYNVMFLDNEGQLWFSEEYCNFQLNELQKRIDKAIKMLEEAQKGLEDWHFDGYDPCLEEIIKILKGEDNE